MAIRTLADCRIFRLPRTGFVDIRLWLFAAFVFGNCSVALPLRAATQVVVWGLNRYGICDVPAALYDVMTVSCGHEFALSLRHDGSIISWGANYEGEREVPAGIESVAAVYGGDFTSFALMRDGRLTSWGSVPDSPMPTSATNVISVSASASHVIALRADSTVVMWGSTNIPGIFDMPEDLTDVVQVSAGYKFSLALKSSG